MIRISVVIGYRNRDTERVKNALDSIAVQTLDGIEVIFVDYGSDDAYAGAVRKVCEQYPFVKYVYNDTRGMPWNRSHALNSGIRLASADYVLLGDIDWVYGPETFKEMHRLVSEEVRVFCRNYLLPENIPFETQLFQNVPPDLTITHENGGGGAHLISKKLLEKIRGFDEYYCFWGVEDRDLYSRLDQLGIKSIGIDIEEYPVFHQWHPEVSGAKRGFFPDRWWENMNIYYQLNISKLVRNDANWGKLFAKENRKVFDARDVLFDYSRSGDWFYRGLVAFQLVEKLQNLKNDECLTIEVSKTKYQAGRKIKTINRLLGFLPGDLIATRDRSGQFDPEKDMIYMIWKLVKDSQLIKDYSLTETEEKIVIRLMT